MNSIDDYHLVLQAGNLFYFAFNLAAGFSRSMLQLLLFRLLSEMGASASLAVAVTYWGHILQEEPNEIWEPSVPAFLQSPFWVGNHRGEPAHYQIE